MHTQAIVYVLVSGDGAILATESYAHVDERSSYLLRTKSDEELNEPANQLRESFLIPAASEYWLS